MDILSQLKVFASMSAPLDIVLHDNALWLAVLKAKYGWACGDYVEAVRAKDANALEKATRIIEAFELLIAVEEEKQNAPS